MPVSRETDGALVDGVPRRRQEAFKPLPRQVGVETGT